MIDLICNSSGALYYAVIEHGDIKCKWPWLDVPTGIRKLYRKRSDFWTRAPWCVAKQYMAPHL